MLIATGEGLIEVTSKRVAVLTDLAGRSHRRGESRRGVEARLHEKLSVEEVTSVNASLALAGPN